jgi:tRNA-2-methylthio-N6-dimethylallyladenosine synthase
VKITEPMTFYIKGDLVETAVAVNG